MFNYRYLAGLCAVVGILLICAGLSIISVKKMRRIAKERRSNPGHIIMESDNRDVLVGNTRGSVGSLPSDVIYAPQQPRPRTIP